MNNSSLDTSTINPSIASGALSMPYGPALPSIFSNTNPSTSPVITSAPAKKAYETVQASANNLSQSAQQKAIYDKQQADIAAQSKALSDVEAGKKKQAENDTLTKFNSTADQGMHYVPSPNGYVSVPMVFNDFASYQASLPQTNPSVAPGAVPVDSTGYQTTATSTDFNRLDNAYYIQLQNAGFDLTGAIKNADNTYSIPKETQDAWGQGPVSGLRVDQVIAAKKINDANKGKEKDLATYNAGAFPLTANQQAQLDNIKRQNAELLVKQQTANANREGGVLVANARYGTALSTNAGNQYNQAVTDGVSKMADLQAELNDAVNKITQAFQDQNYKAADAAFDQIISAQNAQTKVLDDVQAKQTAALKELNEHNAQVAKDKAAAEQKKQEDISKYKLEAYKNGAGTDSAVSQALEAANSIEEIAAVAGDYLQSASGIIGEYNLAKRQGYSGSFRDYQNEDANRKVRIAAASQAAIEGTDLNTKDRAVFNSIVDKNNASPAIKALDTIQTLKNSVAAVKANPQASADQLWLMYSFIKGLDPNSAVREGEITLANNLNSFGDKVELFKDKIMNREILTRKASLDIADTAEKIVKSIEDTAATKRKSLLAQARQNGTNVFKAATDYVNEVQSIPTVIQQNENLDQKVTSYGDEHPEFRAQIVKMRKEGMTPQEIYEFLNYTPTK